MKLIITVISLISLLTINCKAQINTTKSEKFDLELFNNNKTKSNEYRYTEKGTEILLSETQDNYLKITSKIDENFTNHYLFDKKELSLSAEQQFFLNIPVGHYITYNDKGEVLQKQEPKNLYPFTIYQLIDKMKNDFNLDINKKIKRLTIGVNHDEKNNPYYFVRYPTNDTSGNSYRFIKIDAISGAFISENIAYDIEN